jgi:hypothetical protein
VTSCARDASWYWRAVKLSLGLMHFTWSCLKLTLCWNFIQFLTSPCWYDGTFFLFRDQIIVSNY